MLDISCRFEITMFFEHHHSNIFFSVILPMLIKFGVNEFNGNA